MRKSVLPWLACVIAALIAIPAFASGAALRGEPTAPARPSAPAAPPTVTWENAARTRASIRRSSSRTTSSRTPGRPTLTTTSSRSTPARRSRGQPDRCPPAAQRRVHRRAARTSCTQLDGRSRSTRTRPRPLPDVAVLRGLDRRVPVHDRRARTPSSVTPSTQEMIGRSRHRRRDATPTPTYPTPDGDGHATPTPPAGPAIVAKDGGAEPYWFQDASSTDPTDNSVTIPAGGTVNFSYPVGVTVHNVDFVAAAAEGRSRTCVQTAGTVVRRRCRRCRTTSSRRAGRATARSTTPGTYSFVCSAHPSMTGTVVVQSTRRDSAGDDDQQRPGRTDEPDVGELHVLVQPAGGDVRVPAGHTGGQRHLRRVHVAGGVHDDHERQLHVQRPSGAGRDA